MTGTHTIQHPDSILQDVSVLIMPNLKLWHVSRVSPLNGEELISEMKDYYSDN